MEHKKNLNYNHSNFQPQFSGQSRHLNILARLFPYLRNRDLVAKLMIDNASLHYISPRDYAEKISNIIKFHLKKLSKTSDNITITDATAGVGGDSITLAKKFHKVNSIEIDPIRSQYLTNNINVYDLDNVIVYNASCCDLLFKLTNHDVVFIDPPWETETSGSYKKYNNLRLNIGACQIEDLCVNLMDHEMMAKVPELIVLKLPKNYDIEYFYSRTKGHDIYYYDLNKMLILVISVNTNNASDL